MFYTMEMVERQHVVNIFDLQGGYVQILAVDISMRVLEIHFLARGEAHMFRTALGFCKCMPRRDGRLEIWFRRFQVILEQVDRVSGLGLPITFQRWMLLSLLPLFPRTRAELHTGLGNALQAQRADDFRLQKAIPREMILYGFVFDLHQGARGTLGTRTRLTVGDASGPRPLYQCLGTR